MRSRTAATHIHWIRSHSDSADAHSEFNNIADKLANEARMKAERQGCDLPEFKFNEELVIARYMPAEERLRESKRDNPRKPIHVSGDLLTILKIEAKRLLLADVAKQKSQGVAISSNPYDALELFRIIRSRQNPKELEFILETVTQTGDTYQRRQKLSSHGVRWTSIYANNRHCLFCNDEDETTTHIFSCTVARQIFSTEWNSLIAEVDPKRLLTPDFTWFFSAAGKSAALLKDICVTAGILDEEDHDTSSSIEKIAQHPPFAGSLGILPPCISDFYRAYFYSSIPSLRHKRKELMELVQETLSKIRLKLFELSFKIWLEWRRRKRKLLAQLLRADKIRLKKEAAQQAQREIARNMADLQQARAILQRRRAQAAFRRKNPVRFRSRPKGHNFYLTPSKPLARSRPSRLRLRVSA